MNLNHFLYNFFAPYGKFNACGMFTLPHLIGTFICLVIIVISLILFFKLNLYNRLTRLSRIFAIILTVLETIKISHSFIYGDLHLDAWFPLSYCGLFIFALWMTGFGNIKLRRLGEAYITYGCPIAGICFLIFPTTSLMSFPIWHFFSLYSLFFHSVMVFIGVIFLLKSNRLNKDIYLSYTIFVLFFSAIAIALNITYNCNLMNLREPYNIPIEFLQNLYTSFPYGYTLLTLVAYLIIPFVVGGIFRKVKFK